MQAVRDLEERENPIIAPRKYKSLTPPRYGGLILNRRGRHDTRASGYIITAGAADKVSPKFNQLTLSPSLSLISVRVFNPSFLPESAVVGLRSTCRASLNNMAHSVRCLSAAKEGEPF